MERIGEKEEDARERGWGGGVIGDGEDRGERSRAEDRNGEVRSKRD